MSTIFSADRAKKDKIKTYIEDFPFRHADKTRKIHSNTNFTWEKEKMSSQLEETNKSTRV